MKNLSILDFLKLEYSIVLLFSMTSCFVTQKRLAMTINEDYELYGRQSNYLLIIKKANEKILETELFDGKKECITNIIPLGLSEYKNLELNFPFDYSENYSSQYITFKSDNQDTIIQRNKIKTSAIKEDVNWYTKSIITKYKCSHCNKRNYNAIIQIERWVKKNGDYMKTSNLCESL